MAVQATLVDQLKEFAENAKDWEELKTPVAGIFVVKPKTKKDEKPTLMLEIRPTDAEKKVIGRSKIFIRSKETLQRLQESITHERLESVIEAIESYNTEHQETKKEDEKVLSF